MRRPYMAPAKESWLSKELRPNRSSTFGLGSYLPVNSISENGLPSLYSRRVVPSNVPAIFTNLLGSNVRGSGEIIFPSSLDTPNFTNLPPSSMLTNHPALDSAFMFEIMGAYVSNQGSGLNQKEKEKSLNEKSLW